MDKQTKPTKEDYAAIGLHTDEEIIKYEEAMAEREQLKADQKEMRRQINELLADRDFRANQKVKPNQLEN
jgi:hypothetical protein